MVLADPVCVLLGCNFPMVEPRSADMLAGIKLGMAGLKKPKQRPEDRSNGHYSLPEDAAGGASATEDREDVRVIAGAAGGGGGGDTIKKAWRAKEAPARPKTGGVEDGDVTIFPPPEGFDGIVAELFTDPRMLQKVRVAMHDARKEAKDVLTNGFELIEHPGIMAEFSRDDFLEGERVDAYHERLCAFVKTKLGAETVTCFSHKLRLSPEVDYGAGKSGYAGMIHADMSIPRALDYVESALEE